jgi:hypothetical protein
MIELPVSIDSHMYCITADRKCDKGCDITHPFYYVWPLRRNATAFCMKLLLGIVAQTALKNT